MAHVVDCVSCSTTAMCNLNLNFCIFSTNKGAGLTYICTLKKISFLLLPHLLPFIRSGAGLIPFFLSPHSKLFVAFLLCCSCLVAQKWPLDE